MLPSEEIRRGLRYGLGVVGAFLALLIASTLITILIFIP